MKILLVNNHTKHMASLKQALAGHDVEVVEYRPGANLRDSDKDLVILSGGGGEGLEITDKISRSRLWYQDEINFVRQTDKPVLGICMGFEVLVQAYGGKVHYQPKLIHGLKVSHLTDQGSRLFKHQTISQLEAHYWYVPEVPESLDVLASSKTGIEMIRHKHKRQLGTQFHPESADGTLYLSQLVTQFAA